MKRNSAYLKYKPSGVEWLGDVPEHWVVKKIKWNTPVLRGASPRPIDNQIYFDDDGEYAWVRIADVTASHVCLNDTTQRLSDIGANLSVKLNPGSLFLSIAATVGVPCIAGIKCCIHDGFVHFPSLRADVKFMFYIFACGEPYKGLGKLGTQLNLNTDTVGSIKVAFPTLPEQQAIVAFLDRETGRIDTLLAKKERLIELLREKRSAMISHAVTKGIDPSVKMKPSGVEWLGDVPEHWEVKRIKNISNTISKGTTPSTEGFEISLEGIIKFIKAENIVEDNVSHYPEFFIDEETNRALSRSILREKDLLIVIAGATIGKVAILKREFIPANTNQAVCFIRLRNPEIARFIWYYLRSDLIRNLIATNSVQSAQPNISMGTLKDTVVPHPPRPEQQAIAAFLNRETEKIDALIAKVEAAIAKLKEYRTALISAAVTGKIDVREAA